MFITPQRFTEIYREVGPVLSGNVPSDVEVGEGVEFNPDFDYRKVGADFDGDDTVTVSDLLSFLIVYGQQVEGSTNNNPVVTITTTDALGAFSTGDDPFNQVEVTNVDNFE